MFVVAQRRLATALPAIGCVGRFGDSGEYTPSPQLMNGSYTFSGMGGGLPVITEDVLSQLAAWQRWKNQSSQTAAMSLSASLGPLVVNQSFSFYAGQFDGKQVYATHNYSEIQLQNILLTAKNGSLTYRENGVIYRVSQQTYKDGAILLRLSPVIDFGYAEKLIFVLYAASFIIIYILVLLLVLRRIGRGVVQPLETLTEHTRLLASGSLDENIPDEGVSEINALGKEIETLRLRLKKEVYQNKKSADSRKFLISSMSHDLRTPITSLHGYLEGIIDGVADSEEKRGLYVRKALEKVDLINRMIGDLLLYSKLDQNQIEFHCTYVDIAKYLEA